MKVEFRERDGNEIGDTVDEVFRDEFFRGGELFRGGSLERPKRLKIGDMSDA